MTAAVVGSNSLADLAARIRAEHEAASAALNQGLQHAVAAGGLLRTSHNGPSARAAIARAGCRSLPRSTFANLDDEAKAQRVADLSFRDALNSLAATGSILKQVPTESWDRALQGVEDHENAETWRHAVQRVRREDLYASQTLETPAAMLPSRAGRKIRVARNPTERRWLLAIGPDVSLATLKERETRARETATVRQLQQERDELIERVAALEAEAEALRKDASLVRREIDRQVRKEIGPALPLTETYHFQCDEETDAELVGLGQEQLVEILLAVRSWDAGTGAGIREIQRGYWGDMAFMSLHPMPAGPGHWTKIGSPEWLEGIFPDLIEPDEKHAAPQAEAESVGGAP